MTKPRLAIVFYSTYGTNHELARIAAEAAQSSGADVRLRRIAETAPKAVVDGQEAWKSQLARMQDIPEVSHDDMTWAEGYFFIAPTRYGSVPSQVRAFIDTLGPLWQAGKLADKTFTAATSASTRHGGHEATLLALYTSAMHWGTVIVTPGYTDPVLFETGNPYGFSVIAGQLDENGRKALEHQARRLTAMTARVAAKEPATV